MNTNTITSVNREMIYKINTTNGYYVKYITADCYHVMSTPKGDIVLTYSESESLDSAFSDIKEKAFYDQLHQNFDDLDERNAFYDAQIEERDKRVTELLELSEVQRCYVKWGGNLEVLGFSDEDRAKVFKMQYDQSYCGHLASGFSVQRHKTEKGYYIGHLIGSHDQYWKFRFKTGDLEDFSHRFGLDPDLPKLTVSIVKGYIDTDGEIELIARCALKAIISLQLQHESQFGRDPHCDRILHLPTRDPLDHYDGSAYELIEEIQVIQIEEEALDGEVPF